MENISVTISNEHNYWLRCETFNCLKEVRGWIRAARKAYGPFAKIEARQNTARRKLTGDA